MVASTRDKLRKRFLMTSLFVMFLMSSLLLDVAPTTSSAASYSGPPIPTMYFPDECVSTSVSGFNEGVIVSQRGNRYLPNTACTMYLSVRATSKNLRFIFEHMDLPETGPGDCEDFIQFYASDNGSGWTAIGRRMCGHSPPEDIVSPVTNVSVVFTTDGFRERSGFRFRFRLEHTTEVCAPGRGCAALGSVATRTSTHNGNSKATRFSGVLSSIFVLGLLCVTFLALWRLQRGDITLAGKR